jgi:hypothetical protein
MSPVVGIPARPAAVQAVEPEEQKREKEHAERRYEEKHIPGPKRVLDQDDCERHIEDRQGRVDNQPLALANLFRAQGDGLPPRDVVFGVKDMRS